MNRILAVLLVILCGICRAQAPIPRAEKLVALTFDDACLSHRTIAAPKLKARGFGATFFVCEYPGIFEQTEHSMTWAQIRELHDMGFEIGNHTLTHRHAPSSRAEGYASELQALDERCAAVGIPKPVSFAWPAYKNTEAAMAVLRSHGIQWARVGGGTTIDRATLDPLLIPSVSTSGSDEKAVERVLGAIARCDEAHPLVLTFHGVPDTGHPQVNTPPELFERYLQALADQGCTVLSLRELMQRITAKSGSGSGG